MGQIWPPPSAILGIFLRQKEEYQPFFCASSPLLEGVGIGKIDELAVKLADPHAVFL